MLTLQAAKTALILVDLQKGIVAAPLQPHSAASVIQVGSSLADRFREAGAPVVIVNVDFAADFADALKTPVDMPSQFGAGGLPADWAQPADGLAKPTDIRVTKRQWGAFYGTDLDLQLRRRGVTTVVIAGVATNMGVESTARAAHEHGYAVVLVEDGCSAHSTEMHRFAFGQILPRLARIVDANGIELQG